MQFKDIATIKIIVSPWSMESQDSELSGSIWHAYIVRIASI